MFAVIALLFILLLIGAIFYGYGIVMRRSPTEEELRTERCTLCRQRFEKRELVERMVGDSKLYYFCSSCIASLAADAGTPFTSSTSLPDLIPHHKSDNGSD